MSETYPFQLTPLPYPYNALEPYIDAETMRLHHNAHLKTYIDNLNALLEKYPSMQNMTLEQILLLPTARFSPTTQTQHQRIPAEDREKLRRNAGGVYNHRFFFESLAPGSKQRPRGQLAAAIDRSYGSFDSFRQKFTEAAKSVFGSGYAWLGVDRRGNLVIVTSANQDVPRDICPLLNLDLWEHAYYLKHQNRRDSYINDWWNVVSYPVVEARYQSCYNPQTRNYS